MGKVKQASIEIEIMLDGEIADTEEAKAEVREIFNSLTPAQKALVNYAIELVKEDLEAFQALAVATSAGEVEQTREAAEAFVNALRK